MKWLGYSKNKSFFKNRHSAFNESRALNIYYIKIVEILGKFSALKLDFDPCVLYSEMESCKKSFSNLIIIFTYALKLLLLSNYVDDLRFLHESSFLASLNISDQEKNNVK